RGIRYLLRTQREDGTWAEPEFTGTGFPQVFYLRYQLYPMYFPLLALSQWTAVARDDHESSAELDATGHFADPSPSH
ncbi:MAG TPA: hypothetical protein VGZ26_06310, partial [Pirellulales bacterium]|nr:hypothetical protein [Pirellulales bacterium]